MSDEIYVVCLPIKGNEQHEFVPGSVIDNCFRCKQEISISPATNKVRLEKKMTVACMDCVGALAAEEIGRGEGPPKTMPMTTDQFTELMDSWAPKPGPK